VNATADSLLAAEVERLAAKGPPSLAARRRAALEAYLAAPLPDRAQHLWRYTDPARLVPTGLQPAEVRSGGGVDGIDQEGVRAVGFGAYLSGGASRDRFATLCSETTGKFEALNLALFSGGMVVEVAAGARPQTPLVALHEEPPQGGGLYCPRMLLVLGEGAEASVTEVFQSRDAVGMAHAVTEVFLAPGARLVHTVVNTLGPRTRAHLVQRAWLESGASLTSIAVGLGGELVKLDASAVLAGERARSEVLGLSFGTGRQHLDSHYFQDHAAPRTQSDLLVKAALSGRARSSYTGQLRIAEGAPGSEAHQENRNLLLSEQSRADSIPELEILTHEVMCSHAAASGPVDPAMLFYLRSRGLAAADAERAIVMGFLEPVFARVPGAASADGLRRLAARRLGGTEEPEADEGAA
jgi:Fe-S cluster assembly protein SufD